MNGRIMAADIPMNPKVRSATELVVAMAVPLAAGLALPAKLQPFLPYVCVIWIALVARSAGIGAALGAALASTVVNANMFAASGMPLLPLRVILFGAFSFFVAFVTRRYTEATRRTLEENHRRLQALFDTVLDAVLFYDSEGRYVDANPAATTLLGRSREEILQSRIGDFSSSESRDRNIAIKDEVVRSGTSAGETTVVDKAGNLHQIAYRCTANVLPGLHVTVMQDITERKEAERKVRKLSGRLLRLQDDERKRLARQLHDTTAQNLVAVRMNLARIGSMAGTRDAEVKEPLQDSIELVDESIAEIRTLSYLLHPPLIDEAGLLATLRWYTRGFQTRSGIRVTLELPDELERLPSELETAVFRILQEALTNIQRHSGSKVARIAIAREPDGIRLEVADEGRGIPTQFRTQQEALFASGLGMAGIRERARELGGNVEILSSDGGTTVTARLPLRQAEAV